VVPFRLLQRIGVRQSPAQRLLAGTPDRQAAQVLKERLLVSDLPAGAVQVHVLELGNTGERLTFGDASYMFRLLPRLRMAVILHYGDDEFPPTVKVLFDAAAGHYLPTEDLSVLGGILASRLIKANQG